MSKNKVKCNSPIFSTFVSVGRVLNIGLLRFTLLLDTCFLAFYTTTASNPIYHQLSHRECF